MASDVHTEDDEYRFHHRPAGIYVGAPPHGRVADIPGGANADEQRLEHRREIEGLSHEQIEAEKLDYLEGLGITVETLQRWAMERGHAQRVMVSLAEKVASLTTDLETLKTAHATENTILTRIGDFLGLQKVVRQPALNAPTVAPEDVSA